MDESVCHHCYSIQSKILPNLLQDTRPGQNCRIKGNSYEVYEQMGLLLAWSSGYFWARTPVFDHVL